MSPYAEQGGAVYPVIDAKSCIDCHKCIKVCPNRRPVERAESFRCYASWNLKNEERSSSSSGGVGAAFAEYVLSKGGVVYGAAVTVDGMVEHIRVVDAGDLHRLQKSKYVHSHITREIYRQLDEDRAAGRTILFTGTPCQTAGVKSFMGAYDRLFLVDLICHGVPPQQILRDHMRWKTSREVAFFTTRDETGYRLTLYGKCGDVLYQKGFPDDEYEYGFMYGMFFRANCHTCSYACTERCGDVTIGDFWGLKSDAYPKEKVSVILLNTVRGKELLSGCRDCLFLEERSVAEAVAGNAQLRNPSKKTYLRVIFGLLYPRFGYRFAVSAAYLRFRFLRQIWKLKQSPFR